MPKLLFEIGTEELPTSAVAAATNQLPSLISAAMDAASLEFENLTILSTPRRVAVTADVSEGTPKRRVERRGPPAERAFDADGEPTGAGKGFASSCGVDISALEVKDADGGRYVFAQVTEGGETAREVLEKALDGIAGRMNFPKTMRWDASGIRFPRPVRWLVAMLDNEVLDVGWGSLSAGNVTSGHRILGSESIKIESAGTYIEQLAANGVDPDREVRRMRIRELVESEAKSLDGEAVVREHVLDEVTDIVERATVFSGAFDSVYLELPDCVLTTAMEKHQRYFAVRSTTGLLPNFIVVSNAAPEAADRIVSGNLRVLRARLEDARFFVDADLKRPISERVGDTDQILFHPKLGTVADRVRRLEKLVIRIAELVGANVDPGTARTAARLSKADLTTQIVFEFPELQGEIGAEYARRDPKIADAPGGEAIAAAIAGHYLPRSADDAPPADVLSGVLGLADRIDTLVGYLGIGLAPTGSQDPYALRRAVAAVVTITEAFDWNLPIEAANSAAVELYAETGITIDPDETSAALRELIGGRVLRNVDAPRNLALAAAGSDWDSGGDLIDRVKALVSAQASGMLAPIVAAGERPANLAEKLEDPGEPDPSLFSTPSESTLWETAQSSRTALDAAIGTRSYTEALEALGALTGPINGLFDEVMIMDPDPQIRTNRLRLCASVAELFDRPARLSDLNAADLS